jgi:hypothetical protein
MEWGSMAGSVDTEGVVTADPEVGDEVTGIVDTVDDKGLKG